MYPFHIPELLLCEKVLYKEKKQIFTYQISPFTSFFQNTWCTRLQFAKHCGYKSIMLFERAKDLCHMTLRTLRLFHKTVYFWFLFQGNNTNIRNFNVYGINNPIPGKFFPFEVS